VRLRNGTVDCSPIRAITGIQVNPAAQGKAHGASELPELPGAHRPRQIPEVGTSVTELRRPAPNPTQPGAGRKRQASLPVEFGVRSSQDRAVGAALEDPPRSCPMPGLSAPAAKRVRGTDVVATER